MAIFSSNKPDSDAVEYVSLPTFGDQPSRRRLSKTPRKIKWIAFSIIGSSILALTYVLMQDPGRPLGVHHEATKVQHIAADDKIGTTLTTPPILTMTGGSDEPTDSVPTASSPTEIAMITDQKSNAMVNDPVLGSKEDPIHLCYPGMPKNNARFAPAPHNVPPTSRPRTPLFIAFTRNHEMLHQTLLSYLAAGWPPQDIIVIDNSGTMDANPSDLLSSGNPFYLNYTALREDFGVSILQTPTLFSFAQLMNFYLRTAMARGWETFFWSHMDVVVLGDEAAVPYRSLYQRVLDVLLETTIGSAPWAVRFFNYDYLTLVNVHAWRRIGQWDTFIPYYAGDCDAYSRMYDARVEFPENVKVSAGYIFDVADLIHDLEAKLFGQDPGSDSTERDKLNSPTYQSLVWELEKSQRFKQKDQGSHRNSWQGRLKGGKGEPWTYDVEGFERAWWLTAKGGQEVYEKKWETLVCEMFGSKDWNAERAWHAHEVEVAT